MTQIFGATQLIADVQAEDLCIGCGACISICPYFKTFQGKTIMLFPCNLEKGHCHANCPKTEVDLNALSMMQWDRPYTGEPLGFFKEIVAARSKKKFQGSNFQAGGTVSALIYFALSEKSINAAVLTDREGLEPIPKLVTDPQEAILCSGSKFMASPSLSALNQGICQGFQKIGVVGTPCQMTAVSQIRSNPLNPPDFTDPIALSIGLFCNWSLDTRKLCSLLSQKMDINRISGMDIPPPPADRMVIKMDRQTKEFPLSDIKPFIPDGCFICPDMTSELADISIGMYEGRPGWNTLIVRSQKGADLVRRATKKGILEISDMPEKIIQHLSNASAGKKQRALRMLIKKNLLNTMGKDKRSAVRMPLDAVEKIQGVKES